MQGLERYGIPSNHSSGERQRCNVAPWLSANESSLSVVGDECVVVLQPPRTDIRYHQISRRFFRFGVNTDFSELLNSLPTLCQHLQINLVTIRSMWKIRSAGHLFSFDSVSVNQFHSRKRVLFFHFTWDFIVVF